MHFRLHSQMTWLPKMFIAILAFLRFFACQVSFQSTTLTKTFTTLFTFIRFLASVNFKMTNHRTYVIKTFITLWSHSSLFLSWIFLCLLKIFFFAKLLLQCLHTYGFSPVCITITWEINYMLEKKLFSQWSHFKRISPVWILV